MITNRLRSKQTLIIVLTGIVTVFGFFSLLTIPKEATPSVNIPIFLINTLYPGANPSAIQQQVTDKLEQRIKTVSGVKKINSSSTTNISSITVEFKDGIDDNKILSDLKSAIDQTIGSLPSDVKTPTIKKIDITNQPIYSFSVSGPFRGEIIAKRTEKLEDELKSVAGVSDVSIIGSPSRSIKVVLDANKIGGMNLDILQIQSAIKSALVSLPGDKKSVNNKLYSVEISTYPDSVSGLLSTIKNLRLNLGQGKVVYIGDIASVVNSYKTSDKKSFLLSGDSSVNAISFFVTKTPGFDLQTVTKSLKDKVKIFLAENTDLQVIETQTQEGVIKKTYNLFLENFRETALLVFIVMRLFLGMQASIMVVVAFLIVYLVNFRVLKVLGYSFNNIVSFSLILVLGIMVDNLIVIAQGIVSGVKERHETIREAIEYSLKNYASAVIGGTMCTVVIFLPLIFSLKGIIGEFIKSLPIVIDTNLIISLFVSIIVLPVLFAAFGSNPESRKIPTLLTKLEKRGEVMADRFYNLNSTRKKTLRVIRTFWLIFVGSILLIVFGFVKTDFLGNADSDNVWINIKYKPGVSFEENQKITANFVKTINPLIQKKYGNQIEYTTVDIGSVKGVQSSDPIGNNISSISLKLLPSKQRSQTSYEIVEEIQPILQEIKASTTDFVDLYALTQRGGPNSGKPVSFFILGENLDDIGKYVAELLPKLEKIEEIYNITTNIEYTNGKIVYQLNNQKLQELGISPTSAILSLADLQNSSYEPRGITITELSNVDKDTLPIVMFLKGDINSLKVGSSYFSQIVSSTTLKPELKSIEKLNGKLSIKIEADKQNSTPLGDIVPKIEKLIKAQPLGKLTYTPSADIESQAESGQQLGIAIMVGMLLMFIILVIMFDNIFYPFAILSSIFLSIGGSIIILAVLRFSFNFPAQLGIFGVLGVGVNQAIIHIEDFMIFFDKEKMNALDSFRKSIALRFVPIVLTKITTITGLIILALKDEIYGSLAIAFIGGLIMSFFITLLYLPALITLYKEYNGFGVRRFFKKHIQTAINFSIVKLGPVYTNRVKPYFDRISIFIRGKFGIGKEI